MNKILYLLRYIFLMRARQSRAMAYDLYKDYPFGSFGWAKADLLWRCADVWRGLARAMKEK